MDAVLKQKQISKEIIIDKVRKFAYKIGIINCRGGETGRRRGLKILRGQLHVGSIPTSGTSSSLRHEQAQTKK